MKCRLVLALVFALLPQFVDAQRMSTAAVPANGGPPNAAPASGAPANITPTGLWLTQDRGGVIAITPCGSGLCARIVGIVLDHPTDATPVDYRGVSQCGLRLISEARQIRPGLWKGHILDPRNGSIYDAELKLDSRGRLVLRGFLGIPLLGRTETWTRYTGRVPPDCRMQAGRGGEAVDQRQYGGRG